jgi:hypothetical protein
MYIDPSVRIVTKISEGVTSTYILLLYLNTLLIYLAASSSPLTGEGVWLCARACALEEGGSAFTGTSFTFTEI